jgi:hypothetical protein
MSINSLLPEVEPYKDKIPEFILKLYHILEVPYAPFRKNNTHTTSPGSTTTKSSSKTPKSFRTRSSPATSDTNTSPHSSANSICTSSAKFLKFKKKNITCTSKTIISKGDTCTFLPYQEKAYSNLSETSNAKTSLSKPSSPTGKMNSKSRTTSASTKNLHKTTRASKISTAVQMTRTNKKKTKRRGPNNCKHTEHT